MPAAVPPFSDAADAAADLDAHAVPAPVATTPTGQPADAPASAPKPDRDHADALPPGEKAPTEKTEKPEKVAPTEKVEKQEKPAPVAEEPPQLDAIGQALPARTEPDAGDDKTKKAKHKGKDKDKSHLPALSPLAEAACAYVEALLKQKLPRQMVFHGIDHTRSVVKAARRLAVDAGLSAEETETLVLAAFFHDTGYTEKYDGHEAISAELATRFLTKQGFPPERLDQVQQLIMATAIDAPSFGPLADLLVDADRSGMARDDFAARGELLRLEWEIYFPDRSINNSEWAQSQLEYLQNTDFRTEAGRTRFGPGRTATLETQEKALGKRRKKEKKSEKESRETLAQPKRGIETMFHNIYSTHTSLSQMADQKANMMIQLNTLLLSALITYMAARTTTSGISLLANPIVLLPGSLLLITALGSVVTAILSAQPEITSFRFNDRVKPTANRRINLLFFGNFTKLPLEDFQEGMRDLMRQKDALYINMITDIYYLGDVLSKKYRLLKVSYTVFMVGLIMTVFSFVIAVLYKGHL